MSGKKALIMAVLLVAVVALMAGCTGQKTAKTGDNVTMDYALWAGDNATMEETTNATWANEAGIYDQYMDIMGGYVPLSFVIGDGQYKSDFENATIGMKVGEIKNFTIPAENGYPYYPEAVQPVNMSEFIALNLTPYVNQTIEGVYNWRVRVDRIDLNQSDYNNSTVYVDFNSPVAGKALHFKIMLRSIGTPSATPKST